MVSLVRSIISLASDFGLPANFEDWYPILSIPCLLMSWWLNELGHGTDPQSRNILSPASEELISKSSKRWVRHKMTKTYLDPLKRCSYSQRILWAQKLEPMCYSDVTWATRHRKSQATRLLVQQLVRAIKALHYWSYVTDWWIPLTKGQ